LSNSSENPLLGKSLYTNLPITLIPSCSYAHASYSLDDLLGVEPIAHR
jgi:hypothetical protein